MNIEKGIKYSLEEKVTKENCAAAFASGELDVFATPAMIALMEKTASASVKPFLDPGFSTVGTLVNVSHVSATPIGMTVKCESELIEVDRRRLVFSVKAYDESGLIGEGTHERFIIDCEKFFAKANSKLCQ